MHRAVNMRYLALATDYDGTLASGGAIPEEAWESLHRLRSSGRKLILVTGRDLADLREVCPPLDRFDRVVAENGGVVYRPTTREVKLLAPPPPAEFVKAMRERGVRHLGVSQTLVATVKPNETVALEAIRDLGLELKVVFNKDAVMIVSPGITKATGLAAALTELELSPHNVVGVGDAENDHAFLDHCEFAVAVANAVPMVQKRADFVTTAQRADGVRELIDELLADDLQSRENCLRRHCILLGRQHAEPREEFRFFPYGTIALVAGPSGGGKSTVTVGLLERLATTGYQFCVFDPEGDYEGFKEAIVVGDPRQAPSVEEIMQLLHRPRQNVIINLLRIPLAERPQFCAGLLPRLQNLRTRTGRPHWLVFDEAHHLFPAQWDAANVSLPRQLETALLIAVHPDQISPVILKCVNLLVTVGSTPKQTVNELAKTLGKSAPRKLPAALADGQALVWRPSSRDAPTVVDAEPARTERRRHARKYAEGLLIPERSFYFRGPEGKLHLRAYNLILFMEMADGVDDETWLHHLRRGDYSQWFGEIIGDEDLADEARQVEQDEDLDAVESRRRMRAAIERRYTLPENPSLPKAGAAAN